MGLRQRRKRFPRTIQQLLVIAVLIFAMEKMKKSQDDKDFETEVMEMYRYENSKMEDEDLITWRKRNQHLEKMTLMYNMALMLEGSTEASNVQQQARARYNYYKELYDRNEYE